MQPEDLLIQVSPLHASVSLAFTLLAKGHDIPFTALHRGVYSSAEAEAQLIERVESAADFVFGDLQRALKDYESKAHQTVEKGRAAAVKLLGGVKKLGEPKRAEIAGIFLDCQNEISAEGLTVTFDAIRKVEISISGVKLGMKAEFYQEIQSCWDDVIKQVDKERKEAFAILNETSASAENLSVDAVGKALDKTKVKLKRNVEQDAKVKRLMDRFSTDVCALVCQLAEDKGRLFIELCEGTFQIKTDVPLEVFPERVEAMLGLENENVRLVAKKQRDGCIKANVSQVPYIEKEVGSRLAAAFECEMKKIPGIAAENGLMRGIVTELSQTKVGLFNFHEALKCFHDAALDSDVTPEQRRQFYEILIEEIKKLDIPNGKILIDHVVTAALKDRKLSFEKSSLFLQECKG